MWASPSSNANCLLHSLNALLEQDEVGVHQLAQILAIEEPKARVTALSKVHWNELTDSEQNLLLSKAPQLSNSFEIGQIIRIAGDSDDARWRPILKNWTDSWQGITKGWQTYLRTDAENAFAHLQNSKIPEPRRPPKLKAAVSGLQEAAQGSVGHGRLAAEIATRRARVPEFQFIREEAQRRGLRVWLFGGTAASYSHYVKWDLLRELGDARFQANRFDYDYTNIYRSTQDLDIVVSGSAQDAHAFEQELKTHFPYFLGSKAAGWEVRSIKEARGDKGGILDDFGFMNQHTDSNSTGMVELTDPPTGQSVVRDIRDWENSKAPPFLKDVAEGKLTLYHSPKHSETPRFKAGKNPPIFFAIRALTKAFQYDGKIDGEDLAILQREINQFDPKSALANAEVARWIEKNGKKLFQHAVDLEYAWNTLERLGLRKKLISIQNNPHEVDSLAWWMNKEPLRQKPIGEGTGRTAESLGIRTVAHDTNDLSAYDSITRSHTGAPNVFESRQDAAGEYAKYGKGFYTAVGKKGAKDTGITIRFEADQKAREGTDFILVPKDGEKSVGDGAIVLWLNKSALRVIPESLDMSLVQYLSFLANGKSIDPDDQALFLMLKRRLDRSITSIRLSQSEMQEIRSIVLHQLKNDTPNRDAVLQEWLKIEGARLKKDPKEVERLADSLLKKGYQVDPAPLFAGLTELSRGTELEAYVTREWLPSILKTLKPDIGDRALEHCLFSSIPEMQEFGMKALAGQKTKNASTFARALKSIQSQGGDATSWLKAETKTTEQIQEKAAYLALHPELRNFLSEGELRKVSPVLEKVSLLPTFERLAGGRLPAEARSESFQFTGFDFPAGGMRMKLGSPANEAGRFGWDNQHEVTLTKAFEMQATPVTQLQWSLVMGENPSHFKTGGEKVSIKGRDIEMNPNRPVEQISWIDAQKFIEKLNAMDPRYNYRLPTEAEWEYAARAGTDTPYSFGSSVDDLVAHGWHSENSDSQTHDVASLKPNSNGLYDMHGNVMEWTQNWWENARPSHAIDPIGPAQGEYRVSRGGSWYNEPQHLSTARRGLATPDYRSSTNSFRLVRIPK